MQKEIVLKSKGTKRRQTQIIKVKQLKNIIVIRWLITIFI